MGRPKKKSQLDDEKKDKGESSMRTCSFGGECLLSFE